ncbi:hypothetical protein [Pseudonocardia asaccharolytica]|uniref:hypothetical protein n=1 Tax=Pseudonocardia asaccharolytica TaxID=54010 RepID=UPI0011BFE645|nr:hypothetical protein [Pseudonocardia asaccharolytica]
MALAGPAGELGLGASPLVIVAAVVAHVVAARLDPVAASSGERRPAEPAPAQLGAGPPQPGS